MYKTLDWDNVIAITCNPLGRLVETEGIALLSNHGEHRDEDTFKTSGAGAGSVFTATHSAPRCVIDVSFYSVTRFPRQRQFLSPITKFVEQIFYNREINASSFGHNIVLNCR